VDVRSFFHFFKSGRCAFLRYVVIRQARGPRCSGLITDVILYDRPIYSVITGRQCNGHMVEFALSDCSCFLYQFYNSDLMPVIYKLALGFSVDVHEKHYAKG